MVTLAIPINFVVSYIKYTELPLIKISMLEINCWINTIRISTHCIFWICTTVLSTLFPRGRGTAKVYIRVAVSRNNVLHHMYLYVGVYIIVHIIYRYIIVYNISQSCNCASYMRLLGVVNHHVSIKSFTNIWRQKVGRHSLQFCPILLARVSQRMTTEVYEYLLWMYIYLVESLYRNILRARRSIYIFDLRKKDKQNENMNIVIIVFG